jgi:4-alpha-glucanotransferase
VGDLGPNAYRFVDLLAESGQTIWQMLPLCPVGAHGSPYSPHSLFAGNPLLISPELLVRDGYLAELPATSPALDPGLVEYPAAIELKDRLLEAAFKFSFGSERSASDYVGFCERNESWLEDYATYDALSHARGRPWTSWPEGLRKKEKAAIEADWSSLLPGVDRAKFAQFLFEQQWTALKSYAASKAVRILGDVPFYVLNDSCDIWAHPELFRIDASGTPLYVGGVPPDYFSKTGQRWGNAVYDWNRMEQTGYAWWRGRADRALDLADLLRLDHFRGYVAYWEIPASSPTAVSGRWAPVPTSFLGFLKAAFPELPFVAEDLGVITDDVRRAMQELGIPGMRVLQFAFDGHGDNPHLPSNHVRNSLVCTGTHDTNTTLGWYTNEATDRDRGVLESVLGRRVTAASVCRDLMEMAMSSVADICIIPFQDVLGLGEGARMNNPATSTGNWRWRANTGDISSDAFKVLGDLSKASGRS